MKTIYADNNATTAVKHPAVLEVCKDLERNGYQITFLSVDGDGNLNVRERVRADSSLRGWRKRRHGKADES